MTRTESTQKINPSGRSFALVKNVKAGDVLIADGGFTCLPEGLRCLVREDAGGNLYINCASDDMLEAIENETKTTKDLIETDLTAAHLLSGQIEGTGDSAFYMGLYAA